MNARKIDSHPDYPYQEVVIVSKVQLPPEQEWIETTEAVEISGLALSSISRLCRNNKIACKRIGTGRRSIWLVDKASLIEYMNSEKDVGGRPYKTE